MDSRILTNGCRQDRSPKLPVLLLLFCVVVAILPVAAEEDIFSSPASSKKSTTGSYPTSTSFLAATKDGEIPEMLLKGNEAINASSVGSTVSNILQKEYGLDPNNLYGGIPNQMFGFLMIFLTKYELDNHDQQSLRAFQKSQDKLFGRVGDGNREFGNSRAAFKKFATEYSKAVTEYVVSKQRGKEQQQAALEQQQALVAQQNAETQRKAEEAGRKADEKTRQEKKLSDAQAASAKAQHDIQAKAMQEAMEKQDNLRAQKLNGCLASPAYKLWEASLQVQQGEEMITNAQRALDHDDAVQRESGVTDLAARRAAGERIVAGKDLVKNTFELYKKLGGTAATPEKVVPSPDPAAQYR